MLGKQITFCITILLVIQISCSQGRSIKDNLIKHVSYLASDELDGRLACTKGDSLAQNYIVNEFKKAGLRPFFKDDNYRQPVPFLKKIIAANHSIEIRHQKDIFTLHHEKDFVIDHRSGNGNVSGKLVFIGYGIYLPDEEYDDFHRIDLNGKIAICLLSSHSNLSKEMNQKANQPGFKNKIKLLYECGAKAVIFILPTGEIEKKMLKPLSAYHRFGQHSRRLPIPVIKMTNKCISKILNLNLVELSGIRDKLKTSVSSLAFSMDSTIARLNIKLDFIYKSTHNIAGELVGKNKNKTILVGAHYDHLGFSKKIENGDSIRNGADDNASGTAMVIELAKYFSKLNDLPCNLVFTCFAAEEFHLVGSKLFVNALNNSNFSLMINYDMVGRMRGDSLYAYGTSIFVNNPQLSKFSDKILHINSKGKYSSSDDQSFSQVDIPSLMFTTGTHEDFHQVSDETKKINFEGMEKIFHFSKKIIFHLSKNDLRNIDS